MDYSQILGKTAQKIPPSGIRKFFSVVEDIPDAISLGVGEPDFVTPCKKVTPHTPPTADSNRCATE